MKNKIFIDTSFILSLVNGRDFHHEKALKLSRIYEKSSWLTTEAVLLEVGNALAKNHKKESLAVIRAFQQNPSVEIFKISGELFAKGLDIYEKFSDKDWGLVDCISFAVMWDQEIFEVLTFDDDFKQAGFITLGN